MQLTLFSDYAMRTTLYLAAHRDRLVRVQDISDAYGISRHHLLKVVTLLADLGVVDTVRGRNGGLRLGKPPEQINIGALVRATEPDFKLVECFDPKTNTCPIVSACGLAPLLGQAQDAFLGTLDRHTIADLLPGADRLIPLWRRRARKAGGRE
jgi:Rrf2 family nitric oxide-sensitive transcriptional repressor